ncbi:integrator complex subunit 4-like isoform X3 [Gordionus sp. m RMFG-2023]|uniref:integrator complex subunit 4-like isoform X3 n=1 Tax=Gordionus sp. m RMFG-2023 TaxID=3053472 RepID=UPI0031FBEED5
MSTRNLKRKYCSNNAINISNVDTIAITFIRKDDECYIKRNSNLLLKKLHEDEDLFKEIDSNLEKLLSINGNYNLNLFKIINKILGFYERILQKSHYIVTNNGKSQTCLNLNTICNMYSKILINFEKNFEMIFDVVMDCSSLQQYPTFYQNISSKLEHKNLSHQIQQIIVTLNNILSNEIFTPYNNLKDMKHINSNIHYLISNTQIFMNILTLTFKTVCKIIQLNTEFIDQSIADISSKMFKLLQNIIKIMFIFIESGYNKLTHCLSDYISPIAILETTISSIIIIISTHTIINKGKHDNVHSKNLLNYLEHMLIILSTHQEPRIRNIALLSLLDLQYNCKILPLKEVYNLVSITMNDDYDMIRRNSIILLHQIAISHPDRSVNTSTTLREIKNRAFKFLLAEASQLIQSDLDSCQSAPFTYDAKEIPAHPLKSPLLIEDTFHKLCKVVINDISSSIRGLAVRLLAFPYKGYLNVDKNIETNALDILWPLMRGNERESAEILLQTLDKRTLLSNMRKKRSFHERALKGYTTGDSASAIKDDRPLEKIDAGNEICANAGALVHGLEDESSEVRLLTIYSMSALALRSTHKRLNHENSSIDDIDILSFARKTVEFLVDMFNDEILTVRLEAIRALARVITVVTTRSSNYSGESQIGLIFRSDQIEIVLSALEDSSEEIRKALRNIIAHCTVVDVNSIALIVRFLLLNMNKYPQDFYSVCECLRDLASHHSSLILPLIPDLLCAESMKNRQLTDCNDSAFCCQFQFDGPEPEVTEDKSYSAILVLVLNAALHSTAPSQLYTSLMPAYIIDRHYPYLLDTYPAFFPTNLARPQKLLFWFNTTSPASIVTDFLCDTIMRKCDLSQLSRIFMSDSIPDWSNKDLAMISSTIACANLLSLLTKVKIGLVEIFQHLSKLDIVLICEANTYGEIQKLKMFIFEAIYCYRGLTPVLFRQLTTLKVLVLFLLIICNKRTLDKHNEIFSNITLSSINESDLQDLVNVKPYLLDTKTLKSILQDYVRGSTYVSDVKINGSYIHKAEESDKDLQNHDFSFSLSRYTAEIIRPIENRDRDNPAKFIAGMAFKVLLEICLLTSPSQNHKIMDVCNAVSFEQFCKQLRIKVRYPDNKLEYHKIFDSNAKLTETGRFKIETDVLITSEKSWTDPAYVEMSIVLSVDLLLENSDIINEMCIGDLWAHSTAA